jgi:hypothetical protein
MRHGVLRLHLSDEPAFGEKWRAPLIERPRFVAELAAFASWLAAEQHTPLAIHRHLSRVDAALPRYPDRCTQLPT